MIIRKRFSVFIATCFIASLCYGQNYFEEGSKEYFSLNFSRAIELFTKAILNDQEIAKSLMYRGAAKVFLNMPDDALNDLNLSKEVDSNYYKLYYYFGKLYLRNGRYDLAMNNYNKAIALNSNDAASYNERANVKILKSDYTGAINDANKSILIDSTKEYFYSDRGFARLKLKQYADAIKDFTKSLHLEPNQKAFANRGYAYSLINQHKNAVEDYTKSLSINPNDGEIYYYRAKSLVTLGKKNEACEDLKKSGELGYTQSDKALKEMKCN